MHVLDGDQFLVRIFLGESDKWHHTPSPRALLERLPSGERERAGGSLEPGRPATNARASELAGCQGFVPRAASMSEPVEA
jgi:hypothetical protein